MNVFYPHSHGMGHSIASYGCGLLMPNIMRLAKGGTVFWQAFCAAPMCSYNE